MENNSSGRQPVWQWNEIQQVGTDYTDVAEVERYEQRMNEFRDLKAEDEAILAALQLREASDILEIGTGTGHFARAAARAGHRVTAIDISPVMLEYAEQRAKLEKLPEIAFQHAGFLTFQEDARFDAVVSVAVLHHLPDLWKTVALHRVRQVIRPGGMLLLGDVVFSSKAELCPQFESFVHGMPESTQKGASGHIAREYSTLDWIMEGLLERAGFKVVQIAAGDHSFVRYLCQAS